MRLDRLSLALLLLSAIARFWLVDHNTAEAFGVLFLVRFTPKSSLNRTGPPATS